MAGRAFGNSRRPGIDLRTRLQQLPGHRRLMRAAWLSAAATAVLSLAQADLMARVLATVVLGRPGPAELTGPVLALAGVFGARAGVSWLGQVRVAAAAAQVQHVLRARVLAAVQALGPVRLGQRRSGELTTLLGPGLDGLDPYLTEYLPRAALAAVVPVAVMVRVGVADWLSAVLIVVTLPLVPVFAALVGRHTATAAGRQWRGLAALGGHFGDVVRGLTTLRAFGRGAHQVAVVRRMADAYRSATLRTLRIAFLSALVVELVASLSVAVIAVPVGLRLLDGRLGLGTGLLVLFLAPEAYRPLRAVGSAFHAAAAGRAAAEQAFTFLDIPTPAPAATVAAGTTGAAVRTGAGAEIELRSVTVGYPDAEEPVLQEVDLQVAAGERIAVVGSSGAGKSTLLALLLGLLMPQSGTTLLGGTELEDLLGDPQGLASWRARVAWVPQRPHLFATTIAENIALGAPGADPERIAAAANAAGAAEFIGGLPGGYETVLGERGIGLSSGERRRIALARAFCRDAPVLLLDEPTAGIDALGEVAVVETTRALMVGRTVLLATHRPVLLDVVDRIVTVRGNRLAATGRPRSFEDARRIG